jgi:hypothetical protein
MDLLLVAAGLVAGVALTLHALQVARERRVEREQLERMVARAFRRHRDSR